MNNDISLPPVRDDGLQLDEPRQQQRRFWVVERICWVVFALICLIALLGFTGSGGPFQKQQVDFSVATAEIPRISRWEAADSMSISFTAEDDAQEMTVSQPFFETFGLERIQPQPVDSVLTTGGQQFRFLAEGPPPHAVTFDIRAAHFGWLRFDLTIGSETRPISMLVLP
ncbi:hypothetical protein [Paracoccus sp. 228]|uniref:hypothetical protein n=1 Tax=Paracoccus sp. 228 TaxID=1192054 RepID=UPI0005E5D026|nr:hypothetical protein [Paracoccus sp. 228]KIX18073.1 hypothetical protein SY26_06930 [Paracoccus sp. 228]